MHIVGHGNQHVKVFSTTHVPLNESLLLHGDAVEAELAEAKMIQSPVGYKLRLQTAGLLKVLNEQGKRRVRRINQPFDFVFVKRSDSKVSDRRDVHPTCCAFASAALKIYHLEFDKSVR